ncbi:MAG: FKBP-type peptidyl-prolyl cis-trans isomerase [Spirochaetales bacterium]
MKKLLLAAFAVAVLFASCQNTATTPAKTDGTATKADVSYAFGVLIANNLKTTGLEFDYDAMANAMRDTLEKNAPKVTVEVANTTVQTAVTEGMKKKAEANAVKEKAFLESNGKKTGMKTTASGLQYEVIKEGTGVKPKETDKVKVDYVGTLTDGTKFDSSIDRNEPAVFPLAGVIPGWTEGIQLMPVGSQYKFYIPSALGYGEQGYGDKIPGNSTLVFEVTLISIEK